MFHKDQISNTTPRFAFTPHPPSFTSSLHLKTNPMTENQNRRMKSQQWQVLGRALILEDGRDKKSLNYKSQG
jgi:hypothetical protein